MKDFSRSSLAYSSVTAMSKSNPTAINGMFQAANVEAFLKNHPHPEATRKVLVDPYLQFEPPNPSKVNASNDTSSSLSNSHRWSDYTLTGSISGRCSAYSWGQDEAELDRAATESVRRKFNKIDAALFEGRSTGTARVDDECKEWRNNFPHLEVRGIHLLDSMEDGTEMVSPDPFLSLNAHTVEDLESHGCSSKLMILGQKIQPLVLQDLDETSPLYEEVIAAEGTLEEFFAFDNCTEEVQVNASRKNSRLKRHHGLPPVTPNACLREAVMSLASNHLWNEVIGVLQPLVAAVRENSQGRNSAYSLVDNALTPIASALGEGSPQEQPYILRGLRDPPTLTKASGQSGSKFLRLKHSYPPSSQAGGIPSTFPQLTNLSGVMQIRSLSLQQRAHSSYVPNVISREGTPVPTIIERPDSSAVGLRFAKLVTPLPRNSEYQIPTTPGPPVLNSNRLISSRMTNRRNINTTMLKPIEKPKTPAFVPIDSGIRGFKLGGSASHSSPPSTPFVRHTQLPPLEGAAGSVTGSGGQVVSSDRSPTTQMKINAQQKNRVTFNTRIVSAADNTDLWYSSRASGGGGDMRPSTTNTSFRHNSDSQKSSIGRKVSDNNLYFGRMKVVGYAAGFHGGGGSDLKDKVSAVIAEDEEMLEESSPASFTVTGKSGIFQSKPHSVSGRTKSRGHIR